VKVSTQFTKLEAPLKAVVALKGDKHFPGKLNLAKKIYASRSKA
jgi:hypothetical protein